jgi:hypothetical protein
MGYRKKGLLALFLACSPLLAQINPDGQVRQAFVLEQQGQFGEVIPLLGRSSNLLSASPSLSHMRERGNSPRLAKRSSGLCIFLTTILSTLPTMLRLWTTTLGYTTMLGNRASRARCG